MKIIIPIHTHQDFQGNTADYLTAELSEADIIRIMALAEAVKDLKVYKIIEFDFGCTFKVVDYAANPETPEDKKEQISDFDGSMDLVTINITDDEIWWKGNYKGYDVSWHSERVELHLLDKSEDIDRREFVYGEAV
jgi:hypothetical protein